MPHGIHDLSLSVAAKAGAPTRMNMPYELGLDLGTRWFGNSKLRRKVTLVLENKRESAKKALSDMNFGDLRAYDGVTDTLICELRDHFYAFLSSEPGAVPMAFPSHDGTRADANPGIRAQDYGVVGCSSRGSRPASWPVGQRLRHVV